MENKKILDDVIKELKLENIEEEELLENSDEEELLEEDNESEDNDYSLDNEDEDEDEFEDDEEEEDDEFGGSEIIEVDNYDFNKPKTKEEKRDYAFAELRRENKQKGEELKRLQNIAEAYGFKSYDEMVRQLEEEAIAKKAKEENLDPKIYRKIHETEKKLELLEKEREEERLRNKVETVNTRLTSFIQSHGLTEEHKHKLLEYLDSDGFTIDDLYKIKNPNKLFRGYMSDDINEARRQKALEKEKKKVKLTEDKFKSTGSHESYTIDDLINAVVKNRKEEY